MRPKISMRESLADPDLFGPVMQGESWYGWRVLLIAAAGEELTDDERVEFKRLTGRDREPGFMCHEFIAIMGRRAGKTSALSVFDIWISALCDHPLAPGEIGVALIISRDQRAAKIVIDRIDGIMRDSIILGQLIAGRTVDSIELTNGISIEVRPANRVSVRGPTYVSVVCEELAHWHTAVEMANPDTEILASVKPGLLTTRGPLLIASSVYSKTGVLFDSYKKYYGANGPPDILVAFGTSRDLNPSLPQSEIDRELERDPLRNRSEFLSEWRVDVSGFIGREIVENCVGDYIELPRQPNINYQCFIDQATGVEAGDSFAITIAHKLGDRAIVDAVREVRPPFNYFEVVNTVLVPLCKAYLVYKVVGDNYGAELAKDPIRKAGIGFELAAKHKSELYLAFLPILNAGKVTLPKHERAINQICSLERSVKRTGREEITHPIHGHDDVSNSIAGAVDLVYSHFGYDRFYRAWDPQHVDDDVAPAQQQQQPMPQADRRLHGLYASLLGPPAKPAPTLWPAGPKTYWPW